MEKKLLSFVLCIFMIACNSPSKLLQKGDYDSLIDRSVRNLIRNPNSEEDAEMLDRAYKLANERDISRINYLRLEGNPNTWDEVLNLLSRLKNRQAEVRKVTPINLNGRQIEYEFIDYDIQIVEAKRNAADYYYANGKRLMENKTRESYRQAYNEMVKAKEYSGGAYLDLDKLIESARYYGTSRVLIQVVNQTIINLPQEFTDGLVAVNASEMNTQWVEYHTRKLDEDVTYDYMIDILLKEINVSPDLVSNTDNIYKKSIEDGFEYVLDANGNVAKDSVGNDIKKPRYKEIQCVVIEEAKRKDCVINGEVAFVNYSPYTLMKTQPISAGTHFEHVSARAIGDLNALPEDVLKMVNAAPIPFPPDVQMIIDCTEALKVAVREAIVYNRGLIR